jgi:hypothetical protein
VPCRWYCGARLPACCLTALLALAHACPEEYCLGGRTRMRIRTFDLFYAIRADAESILRRCQAKVKGGLGDSRTRIMLSLHHADPGCWVTYRTSQEGVYRRAALEVPRVCVRCGVDRFTSILGVPGARPVSAAMFRRMHRLRLSWQG